MDKINLDDWTLFSDRKGSTSYVSADGKWYLKTYKELSEDRKDAIHDEYLLSEEALALGLPTPKAKDLVELEGGGFGAIFENITNKISYSRRLSEHFEEREMYMKKFAEFGVIVHGTKCDPARLPSYAALIRDYINRLEGLYTDEEKAKLLKVVDETPETYTCLHGDFHPGNFIRGDQGDFLIDLGRLSYGNPIYDWAQWYFLSHLLHDRGVESVFHMPRENVIECFDLSVRYTFNPKDEAEFKAIVEKIGSYAFIASVPNALGFQSVIDDLLEKKKDCPFFK